MAARTAYTDHLANVPIFASFSKRDLQRIAKASDEVEVAAGRVLVDQGRAGHEFFLILEGQAKVSRGGNDLATLGPGQYFGELSLLDGGPRSATVTAASDMELLVVGQREFSGVLDEIPGVAHKLLTAMAARLREADTRSLQH